MKRYLLIFFLFITFIYIYGNDNDNIADVFLHEKDSIYDDYVIDVNVTLKKYLDIFRDIDENDYIIRKIVIAHNYNSYVANEIENIRIIGSNYEDSMNEYIYKYIEILDKYELDSEISKISSGNFKINRLGIYTTKDTYLKIKELFSR